MARSFFIAMCSALLGCVCVSGAVNAANAWIETDPGVERMTVNVQRDRSVVMRTDTVFSEVVTGNPDIADVAAVTDQSFYVLGKSEGGTNLLVYDEAKRLLAIVDVQVSANVIGLRRSLFEAFPDETIEVKAVADGVYLRGEASSAAVAERVAAIAERYAPGRVTNGMSIKSSQQVMLEVRIVEASRRDIEDLGLGMLIARAGEFAFSTGTGVVEGFGQNSGLLGGGQPAARAAGSFDSGDYTIDFVLDALEQKGVVRTLAEPNLVALSGDTASFLAGGEFPVPVAADEGQIAITFRQFGVGVDFTPTVLGDEIINLKVAPEVSQLDPANSVRVGGVEVPALTVRRADTTVELRSGQSFAIAGLLQNFRSDTVVQAPGLGRVPVLGALFRSQRFQQNETELVLIVTPHLVKPSDGKMRLATPLDETRPPSEAEMILEGKVEAARDERGLLDRIFRREGEG